MRIVPVPSANDLTESTPALDVLAGSIIDAPQLIHKPQEGTQTEERWLYELQLAGVLPVVEISKSTASTLLPPTLYQWFELKMHKLNSGLLTLFRISLVAFAGLLVVPTETIKPWIPLVFVISTLPPLNFASFFSLEVLALLVRYYEFWFVSMLNTLTWLGLGVIFGDVRAITCLTLWLNYQTVVAIDANFRTFPAAVKSTVISGPAMVALVICCAYSIVADSSFPTLYIGVLPFQSRQVVVFTASTIAVFMFKKAYTKRRRIRIRLQDRKNNPAPTPGRHSIPCVLILARVRLGLRGVSGAGPNANDRATNLGIRPASANARSVYTNSARIQQFHLAPTKALIVDARNILLPKHMLKYLLSPYTKAVLYGFGALGLSTTAISWFLILHEQQKLTESLEVGIAVVATTCSLIFTVACAALAQRDLLRLLIWNFDVLFSTCQGSVLAICLLDLSRWRASSCLAIVAWWLWFHVLLIIDALTPSLTHKLRIRKYFGLPAVIVVICVAASCAVELLIGDEAIFCSRLLWSVQVVNRAGFDIHTSTLAVQRTVTIVGWFPRLLAELAWGSSNQVLFILRQVEYFSPYATFSEPAVTPSAEFVPTERERRKTRF
ncbi:unnamed protein product [Phytophthora lilii]|uniref:Unnamed protein product n=1 Tax=Phytophthora lilii TaxID=2077276 RepID=A0A9W6TFR9_9STRA|nr:unnamed protein product [Phytophthora lilii]